MTRDGNSDDLPQHWCGDVRVLEPDELRRKCERLEADAARCRHVREHGPEELRYYSHHNGRREWLWSTQDYADRLIDQAIAASHGRGVSGGA